MDNNVNNVIGEVDETELKKNLQRERKTSYMSEYRKINRDKIRENNRRSYHKYKDVRSEDKKNYQKQYYLNNKEKIDKKNKNYYLNNKEKFYDNSNKLVKKKKSESSLFRLTINVRCLVSRTIKIGGYSKNSNTEKILGCSFDEFKLYLESKFESWMNWDNNGNPKDGIIEINKSWDIDHIIPVGSAKTEEELLKLNHYSNLQPLCSYTNRYIKKDK
jgi:hypothetical protein